MFDQYYLNEDGEKVYIIEELGTKFEYMQFSHVPIKLQRTKDKIEKIKLKANEKKDTIFGLLLTNSTHFYGLEKNKILFRCGKCSTLCSSSLKSYDKAGGCQTCGKKKRKDYQNSIKIPKSVALQEIQTVCKRNSITFIKFEGEFTTKFKSKFWYKCKNNHVRLCENIYDFLKGHNCIECRDQSIAEKISLNIEVVEREIDKRNMMLNNTFIGFVGGSYKNGKTKLHLQCNSCNTPFYPTYGNYVNNGSSCPTCSSGESKKLVDVDNIFNDDIIKEKRFLDCKSKKPLPFDRFIPYLNILFEYDGQQHFTIIKHWGGNETLERTKKNDKIKTEYAINNGYNFIRIAYYEDHVKALESFLTLVLKHQDKQIVQIYGEVQILDKK